MIRMDYRTRIYETYGSKFQKLQPERFDVEGARRRAVAYSHYFRGEWLPGNKDAVIGDLACGNGSMLWFFKQRGYANVGGVDISAELVRIARQAVPETPDAVVEGNVLDYLRQRPGTFDLLTGLDIVEHMKKDEALDFLDGCFGALRSGGRLILQTPNADSPMIGTVRYGDFTHEIALNPSSLGLLMDLAGFQRLEFRETGPVWGSGLTSSLRALLWQGIRLWLKFWNVVEMGSEGSGVHTRVFLATGRKP